MSEAPLSATEFHVLLVLLDGERYGYAIKKAVEAESGGRIAPEIGSLYRLISRLMAAGLVEESAGPRGAAEVYPGRTRRYFRVTRAGREAAREEGARLREVLALAEARKAVPRRGGV